MQFAQLVDDDGILVLASARSLAARFHSRAYDYDFPKELVEGSQAEACCGWQSQEEGDVTITIREPPEVPAELPRGVHYLGCIDFQDGDELLLLPYSQFTMACAHGQGVPQDVEGLSARFPFPAGRHACFARVAPVRGDFDEAPPLVFNVFLREANGTAGSLPEVPVIARIS